jgi:hypothetical protein
MAPSATVAILPLDSPAVLFSATIHVRETDFGVMVTPEHGIEFCVLGFGLRSLDNSQLTRRIPSAEIGEAFKFSSRAASDSRPGNRSIFRTAACCRRH